MNATEPTPARRLIFVGAVEDQALFSRMFATWRERGCAVEIWSEMSEHTYRNARGLVGRLWMRVRINLVFPLRVGWRLLCGAGGRTLVVTSTPFVLPAVAGVMKRRSDRACQMLYDLYPDALVVAGKLGARSLPTRFIGWLVGIGMRRCDLTVFPGERLCAYTDATYGPCPRTAVVPVGTDAGHLGRERMLPGEGTRSVVYVGNFGHLHDYATLAELLRTGLPAGLRLAFHANGANYERFKAFASEWPEETRARVTFGGPLGRGEWAQVMQEADAGLVLFRNGAERVAFPSKTFSAMAAGQAILAVTPCESDLADVIRLHDCGWASVPGDVEALRRGFAAVAGDRGELARRQAAAAAAAREHYDVVRLAERWLEFFDEMTPRERVGERGASR